jgi:hypothetical protein
MLLEAMQFRDRRNLSLLVTLVGRETTAGGSSAGCRQRRYRRRWQRRNEDGILRRAIGMGLDLVARRTAWAAFIWAMPSWRLSSLHSPIATSR